MSDLSWLNPTPHAIAVYASRPPSPVATQHSLPSGRYSLLGPDFHRLDRTSFAWRTHSINYNVDETFGGFEAQSGGYFLDQPQKLEHVAGSLNLQFKAFQKFCCCRFGGDRICLLKH